MSHLRSVVMFPLFSFHMMFRDVLDLFLSTRHLCYRYNTATTVSTEEERIIIERELNQPTEHTQGK